MRTTSDSPELDLGESPWARSARQVAPLFRWAGGKQRFLWQHRGLLPDLNGTYFEPFAGGLSVYFHYVKSSTKPFRAVIGDVNLRLIRCYKEVAEDPGGVSDRLESLRAGYLSAVDRGAFFYDVREQHNLISPRTDAARFIFLMAAGWNGVYRSNQRGQFNVPHGNVKQLKLPTLKQLQAVATVFLMADLRARSWEATLNTVRPGDFVFLDPPYVDSNRGDLYERSQLFTPRDQVKLAEALVRLQDSGVDFLLTNSASRETHEMYSDLGLQVRVVEALRSVSAQVNARETDAELVVTPNRGLRSQREQELATVLRIKRLNKKAGGEQ